MAKTKAQNKTEVKETEITTATVKGPVSFEPTEEYMTNVLKALGFRKYRSGDTFYYLPVAVSPMKKITEKKAKELFKQE